jgi:prepilin-type N-terminal cleavage/methylation domain-containing protein
MQFGGPMHHLRRDDRGVTLIEVLVAIVILGIIIVPLGNALISFSRNTDDTTRRLSESHDVQIMAAYFAQDVQSVGVRKWTTDGYPLEQSVEVNAPAGGGIYKCGTTGTPAAVVRFAWDDPTTASGLRRVIVSYVVTPPTVGAERQLHRITCVASPPDPSTPTSDIVLAHNVDTVDLPTCPTSCTAAPAVPQTVTLTVKIKNSGTSGPALTVTLTGQRRQT